MLSLQKVLQPHTNMIAVILFFLIKRIRKIRLSQRR